MKQFIQRLIQAVKSFRPFRRAKYFEWKIEVTDKSQGGEA